MDDDDGNSLYVITANREKEKDLVSTTENSDGRGHEVVVVVVYRLFLIWILLVHFLHYYHISLLVEGRSSIKKNMYAPKIATAAALSLTSFSSTTTGFSSLRSVWPAFVTTATSSWSDGRLPLFGSCHLHQPKTNRGHSSPNSPRRVIITKRRMTTTSTTTGSSSSPSISNSATTTMTDVTTGATTSTTDTSERLENSERQHDIQAEFEWRDVLPMEKGSHNSSRIFIPSARVKDDDDDDVEDPFDDQMFRQRLESTLYMCQALGKSSLWIHIPMTRARLIEDMVALGLRFHHAERMTAVLNVWLKTDCQSKIPEYATHNVGVGAVVVNSRQQILVVREQRRNYMPWKTPTGLTELGESIDQAAEREVRKKQKTCFFFVSNRMCVSRTEYRLFCDERTSLVPIAIWFFEFFSHPKTFFPHSIHN